MNSIGLVWALADIECPTTDPENPVFSARLLPDCSPLGEGACRLDGFSGVQHTFVALLTAQERTIQSLIDEYVLRRDRGEPPCTVVNRSR